MKTQADHDKALKEARAAARAAEAAWAAAEAWAAEAAKAAEAAWAKVIAADRAFLKAHEDLEAERAKGGL